MIAFALVPVFFAGEMLEYGTIELRLQKSEVGGGPKITEHYTKSWDMK